MYKANLTASTFLYSHVFCAWRGAALCHVYARWCTSADGIQSVSIRFDLD